MNNINKTSLPIEIFGIIPPKKKNFRFYKIRRARPAKIKKNRSASGKKEINSKEMIQYRDATEGITFEEWMKLAKQYANKFHNITFRGNHCFWKVVSTHWHLKNSPEIGVKDAIYIFGL